MALDLKKMLCDKDVFNVKSLRQMICQLFSNMSFIQQDASCHRQHCRPQKVKGFRIYEVYPHFSSHP